MIALTFIEHADATTRFLAYEAKVVDKKFKIALELTWA